jgi:HEAT repeat protein
MKKRRLILVAIGLIAAIVVTIFVWPGEREPEYQGKKLSEWLVNETGQTSEDADRPDWNRPAALAVRKIGTNALPLLLKWIQYEHPPSRSLKAKLQNLVRKAPSGITEVPLIESWLGSALPDPPTGASAAFAILGPRASPAISDLAHLMNESKSSSVSYRAMDALSEIGQEALPVLVAALKDPRSRNRREIAYVIANMAWRGADVSCAVPVFLRCLNDSDFRVAQAVADSLGRFKLTSRTVVPPTVVPALTNAMHDPRGYMKVISTRSLGYFEVEALPAVPLLITCLDDSDPNVAKNAAASLGRLGLEQEIVVPALTEKLSHPDPEVRKWVVIALGDFGEDAKPATPALIKLLSDRSRGTRLETTNALRKIAPELLPPIPPPQDANP